MIIEEEFYECFGIEPECKLDICTRGLYCPEHRISCVGCKYFKENTNIYPEITDRRLLHLIVLLSQYLDISYNTSFENIEDLKNHILKLSIDGYKTVFKSLKPDIQEIFKENEGQ
ncbi:MAG: hypothetical protein IJH34_08240 [Romboutsia sp.]|nr:hypothetical protein [Romboutsia sp.]